MVSLPEAEYLTNEQLSLLPDDAAVQFFHEHGWWISPVCLDGDLLDDAGFGVERYHVGERDWSLPVDLGTDWTSSRQERLRASDYLSLQMEELRRLVEHPVVPAMAARLARTAEIRLFHDQLLYKPPSDPGSSTAIGWHTDKSYWHSCSSAQMLTAWIPFQDSSAEMGTLAVYDGSHRWPHDDDLQNFASRDLGSIEDRLKDEFGAAEPIVLELRRGQVSFHHCRTIHGSRPNASGQVRIACAVHYQDAANRFNARPGRNGRMATHINDALCRRGGDGLPDYSDPAICPRLWPPARRSKAAADRRGGETPAISGAHR